MAQSLPFNRYLLPLFKGDVKIGRQLVCDIRTQEGSKEIVKIKTGLELRAVYLFLNYFIQFYTKQDLLASIKVLLKERDEDFNQLVLSASKDNFPQQDLSETFADFPILLERHTVVTCDYSIQDSSHSFSATIRKKTKDSEEVFCCYWLFYSLGMVGEKDLVAMYDEVYAFIKNK